MPTADSVSTAATPPDRGAQLSRGLAGVSTFTLRLLIVALGAVVLWQFIGRLWVVALPVFLALVLTSFLAPLTGLLRGWGLPKALAAAVTILVGVLVLGGLFTLVTQQVVAQAGDLSTSAIQGVQQVRTWAIEHLNVDDRQLTNATDVVIRKVQGSATSIATGVLSGVGIALNALITGLLVLVLTFLFLKDGERFSPWLQGVVGKRAGVHLENVLARAWTVLGSFIRAQAVVGLIDAVFIGVGLVVLRVPLALPLALLTFFGAFVPIVGAVAIGVLSVLVALVTKGVTTAIIVAVIILVVQQLEGNVLSPILQGRSLRLHAAVVILAVTAGGSLFGVVGAFMAVPVVAIAAEVMRYVGECLDANTVEPPTKDVAPAAGTEAATLRKRGLRARFSRRGDNPTAAHDSPRS